MRSDCGELADEPTRHFSSPVLTHTYVIIDRNPIQWQELMMMVIAFHLLVLSLCSVF